ncbi:hypothetical protein BV898_01232 [Hypsibius exemplaris]|uniref:SUEL-type lectin domain-containing protein n=1 Tax=Hypsibius exemplaris TaxID=2072580 RepID=A0A1W0XBZ4_HYPEX|nr:hypothetical protein BV898_01232 [Hypsibius exemplaris]
MTPYFAPLCCLVILLCVGSHIPTAAAGADKTLSVQPGKSGTLTCSSGQFINVKSATFPTVGSASANDKCNGPVSVNEAVGKKCWEQSTCQITIKATADMDRSKISKDCKWTVRPLTVIYTCEMQKILRAASKLRVPAEVTITIFKFVVLLLINGVKIVAIGRQQQSDFGRKQSRAARQLGRQITQQ